MTDYGTCHVRLEECNRAATRHVTVEHSTEGREESFLLCDAHADRITQVDRHAGWCVVGNHTLPR